ncbi:MULTISPECIES: hypothetical protein [unclassified Ruegeria]|uniref:hypothetical protein n=2 Tax=Ruegeria TaxID=97050 RepID=UPI00148898EC|nr:MULTISPECIES: hypothetical protein [unclassified Ruegeria]NOD74810.1 hypothetical protein [Ruegeria sp. HKCCD4332]NOD86761.1 hypothetical protein [Ruegeria sp. HKCCD4318]NOE12316.1 hypothetical protein [Ruegeria sp. HKCCD4318-2]NOG09519.1 hypothetical protein [Ruegeria sp. HKCCD4315]
MMKSLYVATSFVVACIAAPAVSLADQSSPYAWTERCLASAEGKLDQAGKTQECIAVILGYCRFSTDSHSCFKNLASYFVDRSKANVDGLPENLEALSQQKHFYQKRLELLNNTSVASRCETPSFDTECAALVSFGRYLGAVSLADWVEKREESQ